MEVFTPSPIGRVVKGNYSYVYPGEAGKLIELKTRGEKSIVPLSTYSQSSMDIP